MNCTRLLVVLSCAATAASALAQTCPQGSGQDLSATQIQNLLSNRYVYGNQYDGQYFNLQHQSGGSGSITDYKRGPNHPSDKSAPVGRYSVSSGAISGRDVVVYTYGNFSYSYSISPKPQGNPSDPGPGTYTFCQRSGSAPNNVGQALSLQVSNTPGPVVP